MRPADISHKFRCPTPPGTLLHRSRLLANLQAALLNQDQATSPVSKLVVVCAPAGYGKTTLLADFVRSTSFPCCWYLLEQGDADVALFLRNLSRSLQQAFPELRLRSMALTDEAALATGQFYQPIIDRLCQDLETQFSGRFGLCLCNFEQINESKPLTDLLNYLLSRLPAQATLLIESRVQPRLKLTSLFIHNKLYLLQSDALRFSAQEIVALAQLYGPAHLSASEATHLATFFDGWIAGILLGADLERSTSRPGELSRLAQPDRHGSAMQIAPDQQQKLLTYLEREIFQQQTVLFQFLYTMSVLQSMDGELCNALLHTTNADELLSGLEQQGLFVSLHDTGQRTGYVCQPVLRRLLSAQLRARDMPLFTELHRRAATLWLARRDYEQAMYHARAIQADELMVRILLDSYRQLLQQGKLDTLASWLQAIDPSTREHTPQICLIGAYIALQQGQHTTTLALLEQASNALSAISTDAHSMPLLIEIACLRVHTLYKMEDYLQAQTLCQQILRQLPGPENDQERELALLLTLCALRLGDISASIPRLQTILYQYGARLPLTQLAEIHAALGEAYEQGGNFALAEHHLTHALRYHEQLHDEQGQVQTLLAQGNLWREQGKYAEAETCLQQALQLARSTNAARSREADVLALLGLVSVEQKHYMQALTFYEDALERCYQEEKPALTRTVLARIATVYLLLGDAASAQLLLGQAQPQNAAPELPGCQLAHALAVSLLLFYQKQYAEARASLEDLERRLRVYGQGWHMQIVYLRLAACHLACQRQTEALHVLEQVAHWLREHPAYRWSVQVELQWLPDLEQMLLHQAQPASLYALLHEEVPPSSSSNPFVAPRGTLVQATPALSIRAFSEPEVLLQGQPVRHWRMARTMELFFLLLDADNPLSKEQIITELWPHFDEGVNQTFHSTIHYLRKLLGASSLLFHAGRYRLNLAATYGTSIWYDVQVFQTCASKAEQALLQRDEATARTAFLQMIELYQGDYGRPFYNNWCLARRSKLRTAYLDACRQLAQFAWRDEAFEESIGYWQRMLQIDDCLEEAHLGLMQCYARLGQRSQALRQYRDCQNTLQQELGIEPEPALQQFYQSLIDSPNVLSLGYRAM